MLADLPRNLFKIEPPYAEIERSGKADPDEIGQQQKSGTWAYGVEDRYRRNDRQPK